MAILKWTCAQSHLLLQLELSKAGLSYGDMTIKQTAGFDALSVFSDRSVAVAGTFQPFMNKAITLDAKRGAHILVSSASYPGTIVDAIIVNQSKLQADPLAYKNFLIGVYKAIAYYNVKPAEFIHLAAPHFNQSDKDFKASIDGSLSYTSIGFPRYFGHSRRHFDRRFLARQLPDAAGGCRFCIDSPGVREIGDREDELRQLRTG